MLLGYIRWTAEGPPIEEQQAALEAAGAEKFWIEGPAPKGKRLSREEAFRQRHFCLKQLRGDAGDILLVYGLDRLGISDTDLTETLLDIASKGVRLRDVRSGKDFPANVHDGLVARELWDAARKQWLIEHTGPARRRRTQTGHLGGKPRVLDDPEKREAVRQIWFNPDLSRAEAERQAGEIVGRPKVSEQTMSREFGERQLSRTRGRPKPVTSTN